MRLVSERFLSQNLRVENYYQDAKAVGRSVDDWLDRKPDGPFFLFVGYMDPHDPYFAHPYDGTAVARVAMPHPSLSQAERLAGLYDAEIQYWDKHFGRLIASLKRRGLYDDTMIVVTSDHGEEFGEHGGFWHGTTLYDEQVHVPLVVRMPGGELKGTTLTDWVRHVDLAPTILHNARVPAPEGMQGGNIFSAGRRPVFAEEDHEGNRLVSIRVPGESGQSDYKLIVANEGNPRGLPPTELFDVARDPGERRNVAARERELMARTRTALEQSLRSSAEGATKLNRGQ